MCERCFANVPATEAFCPECGAAMSHDQGSEGSDTAVYPELARANLLRMRGDYKAAEQQCLTILRRYPNNATANILLGDICAEKGDLDQSMQWYEMALDLAPESAAAQHKLEAVKQRFKEKETAQTVEQLGLPTTKSKAGLYALALIVAVFIFAVSMYFAGQRVQQKVDQRLPNVKPSPEQPTPDSGPVPVPGQKSATPTDEELVKAIQATGTEGARVYAAMEDPRTGAITVTYNVLEGEDAKAIGAFVAQQTFQATNAPVVTVRGLRGDHPVYVANATRALYEETLAPNWSAEHQSNANAWIDHMMSAEWTFQSSDTTKAVQPSTTPTTTTSGSTSAKDDNQPPGDDTAAATTGDQTTPTDQNAEKDDSKPKEGGTTGDTAGAAKPTDHTSDNSNNPPGENPGF